MSEKYRPENSPGNVAREHNHTNSLAADLRHNVEKRIQREKAQLLRDWTAAGGTHADFDEIWPSIHAQLGKIRVQEIGDRARSRSLSTFRK